MPLAFMAPSAGCVGGFVEKVLVDADWGLDVGAAPTTVTSANRTMTVPAGNPGSLNLALTDTGDGSPEYRINSGSWIAVTDGLDIVVADTNTLQFRKFAIVSAGSDCTITVTDNLRGEAVGSWICDV